MSYEAALGAEVRMKTIEEILAEVEADRAAAERRATEYEPAPKPPKAGTAPARVTTTTAPAAAAVMVSTGMKPETKALVVGGGVAAVVVVLAIVAKKKGWIGKR